MNLYPGKPPLSTPESDLLQERPAYNRLLTLFDRETVAARLQAGDSPIPLLRAVREKADAELNRRYREDEDIALLVMSRARFVDELLALVWSRFA